MVVRFEINKKTQHAVFGCDVSEKRTLNLRLTYCSTTADLSCENICSKTFSIKPGILFFYDMYLDAEAC
jgi:hypothetical protein